MSAKVELYNNAYAHYADEVYRQVRVETYGEDLGQTSWVTTTESKRIPELLRLTASSYALEVGCGSGHYAVQVAESIGCRVLGVDINTSGIQNAIQLASSRNISVRVRFEEHDASNALPFENAKFDAAFANDVLCHIPSRGAVLREIFRVLRPGARFLFSDALVISGVISHQEIARRSSIGYYLFSPPGENERLLAESGFRLLDAIDTSADAALIAKRWRDARQTRKDALLPLEGETNFEGLQQFLMTVHTVTGEGRLRRYLYLAEKPN